MHIVGQRDDGYHLLESVVCFTQIGDEISVTLDESKTGFTLEINGPYSALLNDSLLDTCDNLILKATDFALSQLDFKDNKNIGGKITLTKNLPISSGIGGGSADAAATLRTLAQLLNAELHKKLIVSSLSLGADVPMCLHSKPLIARGIGEDIDLILDFPSFHVLLVNPNVAVSTPVIFNQLASKNNPILDTIPQIELSNSTPINQNNWIEYLAGQRNDLQEPAIIAEPIIGDVINAISKTEALLTRMSGSGATCFGLFKSSLACEKARLEITKQHPNWWCVATKTITN